jgi:2-polyprenyl-3-methyl-5-hydroxy-6-metoxy-1,4-benzoquinol methylase
MRRDLYKDIADKENSHWWHKAKRELAKRLSAKYTNKLTSDNKVLDVGCGTGLILESLGTKAKLYGIDSQQEALAICRSKGLKNVKKDDAQNMKFKSNQFDLVTMFDVLEHTDEKKTISEVNRILKKDGIVFITVPAYQWMWSSWDEILKHHKRYTKEDLENLLEKNDFKIIKLSYFYTLIFIPAAIVRKLKSVFSKNGYTSDFALPPSLINQTLLNISKVEMEILLNSSLPFGLSVVAVAKKC